jgi:hypothetical protein
MQIRFATFLLATVVVTCYASSQLEADELGLSDEVIPMLGEPSIGDNVDVEQDAELVEGIAANEGWMICEGWMPYEDAVATDEVIEQTVASEIGTQDINEGIDEVSDGIVSVNKFIESEDISIAEEMAADELLESDEVLSEETEIDYFDDDMQVLDELEARGSETNEEEVADTIGNVDLLNDFERVEGFDGWIVEHSNGETEDVATAESTEELHDEELNDEETVVEETVEGIDTVEVVADQELIEDFEQADEFYEWFYEDELANEELIEEETTIEEIAETADVDELEVVVPTIEEATSDYLPSDIETEEAVEVTESSLVIEETLEGAESLVEDEELQEAVTESRVAAAIAEPIAGTVRTFELGDCKVTIQSDRQMDDFELLDMLWEAVDRLESEMD